MTKVEAVRLVQWLHEQQKEAGTPYPNTVYVEDIVMGFDWHTLKPWSHVTKYVFLAMMEEYDLDLYTQLTTTMLEPQQSC